MSFTSTLKFFKDSRTWGHDIFHYSRSDLKVGNHLPNLNVYLFYFIPQYVLMNYLCTYTSISLYEVNSIDHNQNGQSNVGLAFIGKVSSAYFLHPSVDSMERFYLHDEFVQGFLPDTFGHFRDSYVHFEGGGLGQISGRGVKMCSSQAMITLCPYHEKQLTRYLQRKKASNLHNSWARPCSLKKVIFPFSSVMAYCFCRNC